ncbi:MAG: endonuclease/exonuclease/phosphatase family protein [Acidobacteriota bacterium]|nr:endonuclease/exonuclease/phosphatase family protein [Acidobacteriota bacterium]
MPRSKQLDLACELAIQLGYPHFAVGHNVSLRKGRYGNATLSRFPITRERNIDLTIGSRKRRGCQHTTLWLGGGSRSDNVLEVFNLHLGLSARERELQIGLLLRSRELASLTTDTPCLIGGDFNDWRSLLKPVLTQALGFHFDTQLSTGRSIKTYPSFAPRGGLDRLYSRGRLKLLSARRCRLRESRVASDHRPIIADYEIH